MTADKLYHVAHFTSPVGQGQVYATQVGICRVDLPGAAPSELPVAKAPAGQTCHLAASLLTDYFAGSRVDFSVVPLDLSGYPEFFSRVLRQVFLIPYGQVLSYGEVASLCGSPRAMRAVGAAMAANPIPVIIPCHRVVGASGDLTGYSGPGGKELKKVLLAMEGVLFTGERVKKKVVVMNR